MEVRVEPAVLETASRVCEDLRARLRRGVQDVEPGTESAVSGLPGWHTREALEELMWTWREDFQKLSGYLETLADALRAAAKDYRHTDEANAAHFDIRGR